MTTPLAPAGWTIEDLAELPDNGNRYELLDGSLLVSPPPDIAHAAVADLITTVLKTQAPPQLKVWSTGVGVITRNGTSYFIPDVVVLRADSAKGGGYGLAPSDVLLAVEVLSPTSRGRDLLLKRHEYAAAGIPDYWIVDRDRRRLIVLSLHEGQSEYAVTAEINAGTTYRTDRPFTLELDPDGVC